MTQGVFSLWGGPLFVLAFMGNTNKYKVYVLECTSTSSRVTVHIGIAKDVQKRLQDHKSGKVKATRGREIKWLGNSDLMPHADALRLEMKLKKMSPQQKS